MRKNELRRFVLTSDLEASRAKLRPCPETRDVARRNSTKGVIA